jgi:hypothetical protein
MDKKKMARAATIAERETKGDFTSEARGRQ